MAARGFTIVLIVAGMLVACYGQNDSVVAPGAEAHKLAGDFRFTEGPASDAAGNVYSHRVCERCLVVVDVQVDACEPATACDGPAKGGHGGRQISGN